LFARSLALGIKIQIHQASVSDAAFIADCNLRLAMETEQRQLDPERVTAGVQALLDDPGKGIYFIASRDGALTGQLLITYEWSDWRNGNFWWIQSVYVVAQFRGGGVFRALFEHVHALAKARNDVCGLRLYVDNHNQRAKGAYTRLGMSRADYEMFEMDFVLKQNA
jgi:GNAT superfamily N-acetyltransferase